LLLRAAPSFTHAQTPLVKLKLIIYLLPPTLGSESTAFCGYAAEWDTPIRRLCPAHCRTYVELDMKRPNLPGTPALPEW
jgi:hypothetical protein